MTLKTDTDLKKTVSGLLAGMEIGPFLTINNNYKTDLHKKRYFLKKKLGSGSFGNVWLAEDRITGLLVALKVLSPELSSNKDAMEEVKSNYLKVENLYHPNIVALKALEYDPAPYIGYFLVMEYFKGIDLRMWVANKQKNNEDITIDSIKKIIFSIAGALDYAHNEKIIHRDIKPENIMISTNSKKVKLLDFGLADSIAQPKKCSSNISGISGTLLYMSPEQWKGKRQNSFSDQYSFACLIYELLSGDTPFYHEDVSELQKLVLKGVIKDIPHFTSEVLNVLKKALSLKQNDRFANCLTFISELMSASKKSKIIIESDTEFKPQILTTEKKKEDFLSKEEVPVEKDDERIIDLGNGVSIELVKVKGGDFFMGSTAGKEDEKPLHKVKVDSFWISKTPITQGQWYHIMETKPWLGFVKDNDNLPVCLVNKISCHNFIIKINNILTEKGSNALFRLPTEAEWEYAAKGGNHNSSFIYAGSENIDDVAWYFDNTADAGIKHPRIVKLKKPNELGLFDMCGNVWEWCEDVYDEKYYFECNKTDFIKNPKKSYPDNIIYNTGYFNKLQSVSRGGSWNTVAFDCRVTSRNHDFNDARFIDVGFRCIMYEKN